MMLAEMFKKTFSTILVTVGGQLLVIARAVPMFDKTSCIVLAAGGLAIIWAVFHLCREPERKRARLAGLPREMATALANAQKATKACLAMCEATAFVESLTSSNGSNGTLQKPKGWGGPRETELLLKTRAASIKALERCRGLSVEGLELTTDACYVVLRGIFQSAEAACRECQPGAGLKTCRVLALIEQVSLT